MSKNKQLSKKGIRQLLKFALILIPVVLLSSTKIKGTNLSLGATPTLTPKPSLTPSPLPSPTPILVTSEQLDNWFTNYSNQFSVDRNRLVSIAICESKLNPDAKNGDYGGLFQFAQNTWKVTRTAMNMDTNPDLRFNPEEAIKTAAFKLSVSGGAAWPNCLN